MITNLLIVLEIFDSFDSFNFTLLIFSCYVNYGSRAIMMTFIKTRIVHTNIKVMYGGISVPDRQPDKTNTVARTSVLPCYMIYVTHQDISTLIFHCRSYMIYLKYCCTYLRESERSGF